MFFFVITQIKSQLLKRTISKMQKQTSKRTCCYEIGIFVTEKVINHQGVLIACGRKLLSTRKTHQYFNESELIHAKIVKQFSIKYRKWSGIAQLLHHSALWLVIRVFPRQLICLFLFWVPIGSSWYISFFRLAVVITSVVTGVLTTLIQNAFYSCFFRRSSMTVIVF